MHPESASLSYRIRALSQMSCGLKASIA